MGGGHCDYRVCARLDLREGMTMSLEQLLAAGKSLAEVETMLHWGMVSQETYEEYYELWERSTFRYSR